VEFLTIHSGRTSTIGGMQRLSGLDASSLYLETATMPGGYTFSCPERVGLAELLRASWQHVEP